MSSCAYGMTVLRGGGAGHVVMGHDLDLILSWSGGGGQVCGRAGGNTLSGSASDRYLIALWEDLCENETNTFQ